LKQDGFSMLYRPTTICIGRNSDPSVNAKLVLNTFLSETTTKKQSPRLAKKTPKSHTKKIK
jgi:hypothetical protein